MIMLSYSLVLASVLIVYAAGAVHHLFVGNLAAPYAIHALEFDDEAVTLKKTKTFQAAGSHPWLTFDHTKSNIYGASASNASISSYSVLNASTIRHDASIVSIDDCDNRTAVYVQSRSHPPYNVYSGSWPSPQACGQALSTYENGTLKEVIQTWAYKNSSGIHGMDLSPGDRDLYSADLNGDAIWTHAPGRKWGDDDLAVKGVFNLERTGRHPRHLVVHPNGKVMHVVMEAANEVAELEIDRRRLPVKETGTWSLIPPNTKNASAYWSAEVKYSHNHRYLWATARARSNSTDTGFITVFALGRDGRVETPLLRVPTTTTGGIANAVAPAPWGDEWVAMTDYSRGYVQIWKLGRTTEENHGNEPRRNGDNPEENWRGTFAATAVARVDIADGGCCANAIWYD